MGGPAREELEGVDAKVFAIDIQIKILEYLQTFTLLNKNRQT